MKKLLVIALSILAIFGVLSAIDAIAAPYYPAQGGTGTGTIPQSGQLLIGNGSSTYTPAYLLCSGNCSVANASGTITISVSAQTSSTIQILPVSVATSSFSIVGDGSYITVTNPGTSTIKVALSTSQVLQLLSASSPLAYNSSTGQFTCASCLTSLNGALLVVNNLSDVASTTAARNNLGLGSISTFSKTDYLTSSTVYVSSVNGLNGAVTITSSSLGVIYNPNWISTTTGNWAGTWQGTNSTTFYLASNPNGYITSTPAGGVPSTTPFTAGVLPVVSSSLALTNSNLSQSTSTGNLNASGTLTATFTNDGNTYTSFRKWPNATTTGVTMTNFYTGTVGCQFVVSQTLTPTQIGRFYNASSTNNHTAYIWNITTGAIVASTTITAATTSDSNGYKWGLVTGSPTLFAGIPYSVTIDETAAGDTWIDNTSQAWANTDYFQPVIRRTGANYGPTGSGAQTSIVGASCYDAPAFKYTTEATQQLNAAYSSSSIGGVTETSGGSLILSGNTADQPVRIIAPFPSVTIQPTGAQSTPALIVYGNTGYYFPQIRADGAIVGGDQNNADAAPMEVFSLRQGAPSLTSFANDLFDIRSTISTQISFGANSASPYALWMQTRRTTQADGSSWPLNINPLGGVVSVNNNNVAQTAQFAVNGTVLSGSSGHAGCTEYYDSVTTTQLDYTYPSIALGTMVVTTTKPAFCQ